MFRPYSLKNVNANRYHRLMIYPFVKVKTDRAWERLQKLINSMNGYERKCAIALRFHPYHLRYKQNIQSQMQLARISVPLKEIQEYRIQQEIKDFPMWNPRKSITLVKETE